MIPKSVITASKCSIDISIFSSSSSSLLIQFLMLNFFFQTNSFSFFWSDSQIHFQKKYICLSLSFQNHSFIHFIEHFFSHSLIFLTLYFIQSLHFIFIIFLLLLLLNLFDGNSGNENIIIIHQHKCIQVCVWVCGCVCVLKMIQ